MKPYQEKAETICDFIHKLNLPANHEKVIEYVRKQLDETAQAVAEETREGRGDY